MTRSAPPEEFGSEFHWLSAEWMCPRSSPAASTAVWYGTGRQALVALVGHLRAGAVLVPSWYCHSISLALRAHGTTVVAYSAVTGELHAPIPERPGPVAVVVSNTFGHGKRPPALALGRPYITIEDHTHDPWSEWAAGSSADWCFASFRKTLPVPDGATVWSPGGRSLPSAPPEVIGHAAAAMQKLSGMVLKGQYLAGAPVPKEEYLEAFREGERGYDAPVVISAPTRIGRTVANGWDVARWREARRLNGLALREALEGAAGAEVPWPDTPAVPLGVVLRCRDRCHRDAIREGLIARRVYPAILWPAFPGAEDLSAPSRAETDASLFLHCDGRYSAEEIQRLGRIVRDVVDGAA